MKIGVFLISTRKYAMFVDPLIESINEHFFRDDEVTVHLFTDVNHSFPEDRVGRISVRQTQIMSHGFPNATLLRYRIYCDHATLFKDEDYVFYLDVDTLVEADVGVDMLPVAPSQITAVQHIGALTPGWHDTTWEDDPASTAFLPREARGTYCVGGVIGGTRAGFREMATRIADAIDVDRSNNIMAKWHDESHLNKYLASANPTLLDYSYCYPQNSNRPFKRKIICLVKDHDWIRQ